MALQLEPAFLVAAWLETLIYGVYLCLFCISLYVQFTMSKFQNTHGRVMFVVGILMFVIATVHISLNFFRTLRGYVVYGSSPGGPLAYLGTLSTWHQISKDTLYATQSILGDAVAVYRCWILWSRNYKLLALPLALLIVSTVAGYLVADILATLPPEDTVSNPRLNSWITTFYVVAVVQNTITTSLMAYRLWITEKESANYRVGKGTFLPVMRILIESAALYLTAELILLVVYKTGSQSNAQYIMLDSITPIVGITFCAITIRITLRSRQEYFVSTRTTKMDFALPSSHQTIGQIPMRPLAVNITQQTVDDTIGEEPADKYKSTTTLA